MKKALIIFAGGNGSGKTTLYGRIKHVFGEIPFVNADEMLKEVTGTQDPANAKFGQELATRKIEECFGDGESFCFETVFSHESKIALIKRAKLLGYTVSLYFTHLTNPNDNVIRVKRRKDLGGHDVPAEKILTRIPRTLANVKASLHLVDEFYLFANDYTSGHYLVAYKRPLSGIIVNADAPPWAKEMVRFGASLRVDTAKESKAPAMRIAGKTRHQRCIRCKRFLRGKIRRFHGVCSICEPKIRR